MMEREEFAIISAKLKTFYPKDNVLPNTAAVQLWFDALKDLPAEVLNMALDKWVSLNKWPPTIAELRSIAADITGPVLPGWGQAWESAQKAIRYHGMWSESDALKSMDELTRKTVRSMGFKTLCMSDNPEADRAHFQRIYERFEKEARENRVIPQSLAAAIETTRKEFLTHESACLPWTTE